MELNGIGSGSFASWNHLREAFCGFRKRECLTEDNIATSVVGFSSISYSIASHTSHSSSISLFVVNNAPVTCP